MPDLSSNGFRDAYAFEEELVSERDLWDSIDPDARKDILNGQDSTGEEGDDNNYQDSVYQQKDEDKGSYENADYDSLPDEVKGKVSENMHKMGVFKESFGGTIYTVGNENYYQCKDCDGEAFTSEEDMRVHRKINHEGTSNVKARRAYNETMYMDSKITKENLRKAREILRKTANEVGDPEELPRNRQEFPQNKASAGPRDDPKLPKGKQGYDPNPNEFFYDNKTFKQGSRYDEKGSPATEADPEKTCPICGHFDTDVDAVDQHKAGHFEVTENCKSVEGRYEVTIKNSDDDPGETIELTADSEEDAIAKASQKYGFTGLFNTQVDSAKKIKESFENPDELTGDDIPELIKGKKDFGEEPVLDADEEYDIDEEEDKKAGESRTINSYFGNPKNKAGESLDLNDGLLDGAIDTPYAQESVDDIIYDSKLEGRHEDKIATQLWIRHGIQYEQAIEKIRSIEVSVDDKASKTLFGKKYSEITEAEQTELKLYAGETKKPKGDVK